MSRRSSSSSGRRDVFGIATPRVLATPRLLSKPPLLSFEDRRLFHPDGPVRPARAFHRPNHRLVTASPLSRRLSPFVGFEDPARVLVCVRRRRRRQVLFAKGGAGRRRMRNPRRNYYSSVRC